MGPHRARDGGHLAIRAPNWVGDLVMATPVLAAALASERWERVTILVRAHLAALLADGELAAHLRPLARAESEVAAYRALAPDAALLLPNSFSTAWAAFRARVPLRAGSTLSGRRCLLTHAVVPPSRAGRRAPIPTAHLLRDVAGLVDVHALDLHPRLAVRAELVEAVERELAAMGLTRGERYVACAPGAAFGAAKLWPPEHFAAALDRLHARTGWRAVVTGGPGEEAAMAAVASRCAHGAISLARAPRDLERLKALVRGASLLLVGDSGPRWVAAAFDVPCVSVMGPNFPELTASSLELCRVVRREDLECAPCLERTCPLGHHRCLRELAPERAVAAAEELLALPR